jgi:hypothetical protein
VVGILPRRDQTTVSECIGGSLDHLPGMPQAAPDLGYCGRMRGAGDSAQHHHLKFRETMPLAYFTEGGNRAAARAGKFVDKGDEVAGAVHHDQKVS